MQYVKSDLCKVHVYFGYGCFYDNFLFYHHNSKSLFHELNIVISCVCMLCMCVWPFTCACVYVCCVWTACVYMCMCVHVCVYVCVHLHVPTSSSTALLIMMCLRLIKKLEQQVGLPSEGNSYPANFIRIASASGV